MFGPDICGNERKTHFIINYNNDNHLSNKKLRVEVDSFTHEYTAVIKPDNTYYVYIDGTEVSSGSIEDNWDVLAPKEIPDPNA